MLAGGVNVAVPLDLEKLGTQRGFQPVVQQHQLRLALGWHEPHVELRVVRQNRADPRQHRTGASPPGMAIGAGLLGGQPLAGAVLQRCFAIQRGRQFQAHPGRAAQHAAEKADIEFARLSGAGAHFDADAGCAQAGKALPADQRIGVKQ